MTLHFKPFLILVLILPAIYTFAQERKDTGSMIEYKNEFWDSIKTVADEYAREEKEPRMKFMMDLEGYDLPQSVSEFTHYWHNDPVVQARSGMCWCYSTTSFFESEVYRIHGKKIKLSELHTVYWEYVEKARGFIRTHGDTYLGEGSEANAVPRIWKQYGVVPAEAYTGLKPDQVFHDHEKLFEEFESLLMTIKEQNMWDEEAAIANVRAILDYYIGEPPASFRYEGREYTPKDFLAKVVKLNMDDYVDIMSLKEIPYYEKGEYDVPDNWWHSAEYHNVPLEVFMEAIKQAVRNGYTMSIGGDVSETGYNAHYDVALVPDYDIPAEYINEDARQFRFSNGTTTDDHGIHLVGYLDKDGKDWYLIKDSGSGSRNGSNEGYYFYHEDYVKLKIMDFMVHRDAVKDILDRFQK